MSNRALQRWLKAWMVSYATTFTIFIGFAARDLTMVLFGGSQ